MKKPVFLVILTFMFSAVLSLGLAQHDHGGEPAFVRVVHASPDAPAVDVFLDGEQTIFGAPFGAITPYGDVPAGDHTVVVTAAGDRDAVVIEADVTLEAGVYYTVAAIGLLEDISAQIYTTGGLNTDGSVVELNVYHLSPDGPPVDVLAVDLDNAKVVDALSYPNRATTTVNPMAVNVDVVPAGETSPVVGNLSGISVEGGKSYSVFALGLVGGMGEQAFMLAAVEDTVEMGSMGSMADMAMGDMAMGDMNGMASEFSAILSGDAVVPPVETMASGMAQATLMGSTLTVMGSFTGLSGDLRDYATDPLDPPNPNVTSAAHIHAGHSMESGPFVYNLDVDLAEDGRSGNLSGTFELTDEQLDMLQAGELYVDVHTTTFRGGELRGQLMASAAGMESMGMNGVGSTPMLSALSGAQEVPPVMTEATGVVTTVLEGNMLTLSGTFSGLSSPLREIAGTPAHIHEAPRGENGDVVFLLQVMPDEDMRGGSLSLTTELSDDELQTLMAGGYYVNIHTENNPGGELRAQLVSSDLVTFDATLSGAQEVPEVATGASGSMTVSLDGDTLLVTGSFSELSSDLMPIAGTPAHIHEAPTGENGEVVFLVGMAVDSDRRGGTFSLLERLSDAQRAAFLEGRFYLNIHSDAYPGGELRGQLVPGR